jgi:hypothetical protein
MARKRNLEKGEGLIQFTQQKKYRKLGRKHSLS